MVALLAIFTLLLVAPAFAQAPGEGTGPTTPDIVSTNALTGTNSVAPVALPDALQPIAQFIGPTGTKIVLAVMSFALVLAPFGVWIRNKLANLLNSAAESADEDDDTYLRKILSNKMYRVAAFLLNFANIRLPVLAEFEHALELQKEAAAKAKARGGAVGLLLAFLLPLAFFNMAVSCGPLDPNARPLVVRTEQLGTDAKATFQFVVNLDHANRGWWATNAPAFHRFANELRVPTPCNYNGGTTNLPRWAASLWSLEQVKEAYKAGSVSSNALITATGTIQSMLTEANTWLTFTATNHP